MFRFVALCVGVVFLFGCSDEPEEQFFVNPPFFDGKDGSPCVAASDCEGGTCISELSGWREGYCTTLNCEAGCNGEGAVCKPFLDQTACYSGCETHDECRDGYICFEEERGDGVKFCSASFEDGPDPGAVGYRCEVDSDCNRGICETSLPGGYCLNPTCDTCLGEGRCVDFLDLGEVCAQGCAETRDCRAGYVCRPSGEELVCVPAVDVVPDVPFTTTEAVLGIECAAREVGQSDAGKRYEIDFNVPEDVDSFVMVPFVKEGFVSPVALLTPNSELDLINDYRHHNLRATEMTLYGSTAIGTYGEVSFDWPIQVPYAPKHEGLVVPGAYTLRATSDVSPPCFYVATGSEGTTLDLNIYLVGLDGLDSSNAAADADLAEVLEKVNAIYEGAGFSLGAIRFFDTPVEGTERYSVIRTMTDIKRVTASGAAPGPTLADHMSVDVFLVEEILVGGAGVLLGISASVPGAPGLHGNAGNGLVFTVADLGVDNTFVAYIMAHEIAHYLGLRHTTESVYGLGTEDETYFDSVVGSTDPIADTEVCSSVLTLRTGCPDFGNLMFPMAPPRASAANPTLSEGQGRVLRISPWVR